MFLSLAIWCDFMAVSYRLFRRLVLLDLPHDLFSLADRVGDDRSHEPGKAA
jgi:hypothetical protein